MRHAREDYNARIVDLQEGIPEEEPVFVIRGQDVCAPETLDRYADLAEVVGAGPAFVSAVRAHADRMREWQRTVARKVPDLPAAEDPDDDRE